MRNLKKILALVLALVMSFSLMATANAFTDDEQITDTYETAVTVLDGLKVFQGYDDGSFQPQSPIRRSEVAAIIYRIVTGDVTNAQVGIYADYNKFDDVKSTSWYAGYVNFCANAEYIKGRDARTFDPDSYVTGYEALAMILRAIGYDKNGEFTGSSWQVQTAATGELRGITKNITAGTLGTYASREVVAEILFQTILVDKVNYTPAFGYQLDDTSLGWDTFELESIEGVVVANEYADLYSTKPLKAGRTEMIVDGDSYVIDYATTLEDIGENHAAYITEGKNVLAIAKTGNTVFETGAEADIKTDSKFEDVTGLERDEDTTEYFLNFDGGDTYKSSDWKIAYAKEFGSQDAAEAWVRDYDGSAPDSRIDEDYSNNKYIVTVEFPRNTTISQFDIDEMESIFDAADKESEGDDFVDGEVYVGTQSVTDISDDPDVSWRDFLNKYIDTDENGVEVTANENGNWLKVVDVDGDGVADYVMKTIYTFAGVEDIDRDDNIELSALYHTWDSDDELNELNDDIDIVTADELSEGDIVYYAVIDGNAQTYLADVVTAEIDKVDRNDLIAITTDGDEYVQSDVHNHTYWDEYEDGVKNLAGDTSYDLYFDKYGYLGVFAPTAVTGEFTLIVNGWYDSLKSGDEYSVLAWNGEDLETIDLTDGGKLFIDKHDPDILNNGWDALREFGTHGEINGTGDAMVTTVACLNEDGEIVPVDEVFTRKDVNIIDLGRQYLDDNHWYTGDVYYSDDIAYDTNAISAEDDTDRVEVRALSSTVYYFVYPSGDDYDDVVVKEYVGYANLPELDAQSDGRIEDVYAVGTLTDRESGIGGDIYYTANVVVVEFDARYRADAEQVFIVDTPVVGSSVHIDEVNLIREDGTYEKNVKIDLEDSTGVEFYGVAGNKKILPGLYYMWETTTEGTYIIAPMDNDDIKDAGKYSVGQVSTSTGTYPTDYVGIREYTYFSDTALNQTQAGWDEYKIVEGESDFYTLGYKLDSDDDPYAVFDTGSARKVLAERVDISNEQDANQPAGNIYDGLYYNNNDVLIAYNSDGEIIYAISFNNYRDGMDYDRTWWNGVADDTDFAQIVWNSVKPAGDPEPIYDVQVINKLDTGVTFELKNEDGDVVLSSASADDTIGLYEDDYTLTITDIPGEVDVKYWVTDDTHTSIGNYTDADDTFEIHVDRNMVIEIVGESTTETFTVSEADGIANATTDLPVEDVAYGSTATFTVTPDAGYTIGTVTAEDRTGSEVTVDYNAATGACAIANVTDDIIVTVEAKPIVVKVDVYVTDTEGNELSNLSVAARPVDYDGKYTFALSDAGYIYSMDGENFFNKGEQQEVVVNETNDVDLDTNTMTITVIAYPLTQEVTVTESMDDTYDDTWNFTADPVQTGAEKFSFNYALDGNPDGNLEKARTINYSYTIGDGESETGSEKITTKSGTITIENVGPILAPITITITSVVAEK